MYFEIVGEIEEIETIAVGGRIRDIMRLRRKFGPGRWRKLKGAARVRLANETTRLAEVLLVRGARNRPEEDEDQAIPGLRE